MAKEFKETQTVRLEPSIVALIQKIEPEGNVSRWIRDVIKRELQHYDKDGRRKFIG